jgi:hypothetical protein
MKLNDERMMQKAREALSLLGFYTFEDVMERIADGRMQSFHEEGAFIVTQISNYPRKKVVDIVLVVGELQKIKWLEEEIMNFAKTVGAELVMASAGRKGWWNKSIRTEGWNDVASVYVKEP